VYIQHPSADAIELPLIALDDAAGNDEQLVEAARLGNRAAFSQLYARYAQMVNAIALAHAKPSETADVAQEAFTRALSKLSRLRDVRAFGGWLAIIARNCARDRSRVSPLAEPNPLNPTLSQEERGSAAEAEEALEAVRALPDAYRETLLMRLVEGMTGPEIAARTGLTEGSVRVNLHRGMKMLRERLRSKP